MNITRKILEDAATIGLVGVSADRPEDLDVIHKPGVAAALWRRRARRSRSFRLDRRVCAPECCREVRVVLRADMTVQAA